MKRIILTGLLIPMIAVLSCKEQKQQKIEPTISKEELAKVPTWAKEAIWYQILVERFRNGDQANDPTPTDIAGAMDVAAPTSWKITPWGQDWYQPDDWFQDVPMPNFWDKLQYRRYGGDLQGVLDELDYLQQLGINAIYFNPLNDAPSLHKYDPNCWRHIDHNFGPAPAEDLAIMESENPGDPSTWKWTHADQLFLKVIQECHKRGIRVVMDYSWNHTGRRFWAFQDLKKNGKKSAYTEWYDVEQFDDPSTPEDEFDYKGWAGIKSLPEIKKDIIGEDKEFPFEGNFHSESVKQHIFNVAARWLDPNKDGDLSDGVDGYRLDVAAEIPKGFWPEFREHVRTINPDAYLVGEIWWQKWPDQLMEPQEFLEGNMFDAIMNYRWYRPARHFFAAAPDQMKPSDFVAELEGKLKGIRKDCSQAMMNLTASHDSPRTSTSLYNNGKYKYMVKPYENDQYKIDKPDDQTRAIQEMLLIHQFTYIGAPYIWYGDEVGMWGGDDPDCRKPMIWQDINYDDETTHPSGLKRKRDKVEQDQSLLKFYQELIRIRKANPVLTYGDIEFTLVDDEHNILVYNRRYNDQEVVVAFNRSAEKANVQVTVKQNGKYINTMNPNQAFTSKEGQLQLPLEPMKAIILVHREE